MITFQKIKFEDIPKNVRDAIILFDDNGCTMDETKITAVQLLLLRTFIAQNHPEFKEV